MSKRIKEIIVRYDDKQSFIYGNTLGEVVGELVRCKNCVHWSADKFFCKMFSVGTPGDGYCYMAKGADDE